MGVLTTWLVPALKKCINLRFGTSSGERGRVDMVHKIVTSCHCSKAGRGVSN